MFNVNSYLSQQIDSEEKYYTELKLLLLPALLFMLEDIQRGNYTQVKIRDSMSKYKLSNATKINNVNKLNAERIVTLANHALSNAPKHSDVKQGSITANFLNQQMNVITDNLFNATQGRVLNIIPLAFAGLYSQLYTDETTPKELIDRTLKSAMKMSRDTYTQGVVNCIFNQASSLGYTEYSADNKHDDRVRPLHAKYFVPSNWIKFDSPPPCGHVGTENNCRCIIVALR